MFRSPAARRITAGRVAGVGLGRSVFVGGGLVALLCMQAAARPEGERVAAGTATFARDGSNTLIHASNNAIIDYRSFNIGAGESVRFVQPSATARVLNRVPNSVDPTRIDGSLLSNGIVYISNSAGIYFGSRAVVSVGGLYAAAAQITSADFLANVNHFTDAAGPVVNAGAIRGDGVHLIGRSVSNVGSIEAPRGLVTLAAGDEVYLGEAHGRIMVRVASAADRAADPAGAPAVGVENAGTINAPGGSVRFAAGDIYSLAIKLPGSVRAADVRAEAARGNVQVTGTIDASAAGAGERGGTVEILGERISVRGATIDASGPAGGGVVHVGGDFQGRAGTPTATFTTVDSTTAIRADATDAGRGGEVVLWSEHTTRFSGAISARGGPSGGDGGMVEVSGRTALGFAGRVDTGAPRGRVGTLLLDPTNIRVVDMGEDTFDLADVDEFSDPDLGTGETAIHVSAINAAVADVTLQATNDITFQAAVNIAAAGVGLTAQAGNGIVVEPGASITTNGGAVSLHANVGFVSPAAGGTGVGSITVDAAIDTGADPTGAVSLIVEGGTGGITVNAPITAGGVLMMSAAGGAVALNADASAVGAAIMANDAVTIDGALSSSGAVVVNADADDDGVGLLTIGAGGSVSAADSAIDITAFDLELGGTIDAGAGDAFITVSMGGSLGLGNTIVSPGLGMNISPAEFSRIAAENLTIGVGGGGAVIVNNISMADSAGVAGLVTINAMGPGAAITLQNNPSAFGALVLNANTGIAVAAPVSAYIGGIDLNADFDADGAGTLSIGGGGALMTGTGDIGVTAADVQLAGPIDAGAGAVRVRRSTAGEIGLGNAPAFLALSGSELQLITAGELVVGGVLTTSVAVDGVAEADVANIERVVIEAGADGGTVVFSGDASVFRALGVSADDSITIEADLSTTEGDLSLAADVDGDADVDDAIAVADGVMVHAAGLLSLSAPTGGVTGAGAASFTADGGIVVSSDMTAAGTVVLNADADADGMGTLTIGAGATVSSADQNISITAADVELEGAIDSGMAATLVARSSVGTIALGGMAPPDSLHLSGDELSRITATGLMVGGTTASLILVDGIAEADIGTIAGVTSLLAAADAGQVRFENSASIFNALSAEADDSIIVGVDVSTLVGGITMTANANGDEESFASIQIGADVTVASAAGVQMAAPEGVRLTGPGGGTVTIEAGGDGSVSLPVVASNDNSGLVVRSEGGAAIAAVSVGDGSLSITIDSNSNGVESLGMGFIEAGDVALSGGTDANDTITLSGNVTSGSAVSIINAHDVRLFPGVAILADGAAIDMRTNVGMVTLTGGGGTTNLISSGTGLISLAPVIAADDASLTISASDPGGVAFSTILLSAGEAIFSAPVTPDPGVSINVTAGSVTFLLPVTTTDGGGVTITNSAGLTIEESAPFTLAGPFTQNGAGASVVRAPITAAGPIVFMQNLEVGDVTFDTAASDSEIRFEGEVNGDGADRNLILNAGAGNIAFNQPVGGNSPLGSIQILAVRDLNFASSVLAGTITQSAGAGIAIFAGSVTAIDNGVHLTGTNFLFGGPVTTTTTTGDFVLNNAGSATFQNTAPVLLGGSFSQVGEGPVSMASGITTSGGGISFVAPLTINAAARFETADAGDITLMNSLSLAADFTAAATGSGDVGLGGPVNATAAGFGVLTLSSGSGDVTLLPGATVGDSIAVRALIASGRNISIQSVRTQGGDIELNPAAGTTASGSLGVVPAGIITLNGNLSTILSGNIRLAPAGRSMVPSRATIVHGPDAGNLTISSSGDVAIGRRERFVVFGDLVIFSGGIVSLGDVTTLGDFTINAPTFNIIDRPTGTVLVNQNGAAVLRQEGGGLGANIVSGGNIRLNVGTINEVAQPGDRPPIFADADGNIDGLMGRFRAVKLADNAVTPETLVAGGIVVPIVARGFANTDLATALAGALPTDLRLEDVATETALADADARRLGELGIISRDLTVEELLEALLGRSIYTDIGDTAAARLPAAGVRRFLAEADRVLMKNGIDPATGAAARVPATEDIKGTLQAALLRFRGEATAGETDARLFRRYLETTAGEERALAVVRDVQSLLRELRLLGLSSREEAAARGVILSSIMPPGFTKVAQFEGLFVPADEFDDI